jgi:orotate phosphoribosyltransferase
MLPELAELLSPRRGHFLLESGLHGDLWYDPFRLFSRPSLIAPLATSLASALPEVEVVCGPMPGGGLLAQLVAAELDVEFCFTERLTDTTYRAPAALGARLRDKSAAVVDDVIRSGSAVYATLKVLEQWGARPVTVGALVVLEAPRKRGTPSPWTRSMWNIGLSPVSLAVADESTWRSSEWAPSGCPQCTLGKPLEDPLALSMRAGRADASIAASDVPER